MGVAEVGVEIDVNVDGSDVADGNYCGVVGVPRSVDRVQDQVAQNRAVNASAAVAAHWYY